MTFTGSGWWIAWYGLLWLLMAPFLAFSIAFSRARTGQPSPALDKAFAGTSVGWFGLVIAAVAAAFLGTASVPAAGIWVYLRNVGVVATVSVGLALLVGFPATMYVASHTYPMRSRFGALLLCLVVAGGFLTFCLFATWRFRHR